MGKGIRDAPRDALIADISPVALRGASFGLRQSLDTVGAFIGPLLAIGLMWFTGHDVLAVFRLAVVPATLALALLICAVPEPQRPASVQRARFPLHRDELCRLGRGFWAVIAVASLFTLARFSEAFPLLRAEHVGLPLPWIPGVLVVELLCLIAADLVLALGQGLHALALGVALWGLHMGFTQGLLATLVADTSPAEMRGTAFGVLNLVASVALLAMAALGRVHESPPRH